MDFESSLYVSGRITKRLRYKSTYLIKIPIDASIEEEMKIYENMSRKYDVNVDILKENKNYDRRYAGCCKYDCIV